MFKLLGALVGVYTLVAALKGAVYAKSGIWGRTISKRESPERFWIVIAIYGALSVALLTLF
jgi:hypothetical protein